MNTLMRILANVSTIIGIIVFVYPIIDLKNKDFTPYQIIFISLSIIIFIMYLIYEICSIPKKYKTEDSIKKYMKDWVSKSGRTVIFTRDMSWVDTNEIKNILINKSRSRELIICLPNDISLTDDLKNEGAEIYTYQNLNYVPKSRFTFIHYGSNSSKVAIGRKDDNHNHFITEFTPKDTIEYYLAEDLVNLIKSLR